MVKLLIKLAYEQALEFSDIKKEFQLSTHEVRAFSASWAYNCQVPMEDIMSACSWKSNLTFTSCYLRDLTHIREELMSLGPIVSAQSINSIWLRSLRPASLFMALHIYGLARLARLEKMLSIHTVVWRCHGRSKFLGRNQAGRLSTEIYVSFKLTGENLKDLS